MSAAEPRAPDVVLSIESLSLAFVGGEARIDALRDVTLEVAAGEIVGLVGESGSGKSVTALSVLRLLPAGTVQLGAASRIRVLGADVLRMSDAALRGLRGRDVSMVFQEPMTALNPVRRVRAQLLEILRRHPTGVAADPELRALALLRDMGIADPPRVLAAFPHELSGGLRQRVLIAMAFACNPRLIIADEATTALDVTAQAQILRLLRARAAATRTAVLIITHDLAVVAELCDRTYVMHQGRIVESGPTRDVIGRPGHAYTRALLNALPNGKRPRSRLATAAAAMDAPEEPPPAAPAAATPPAPAAARLTGVRLLEARDVVVRYARDFDLLGRPKGFHTAVDHVSLHVDAGETVAVIGESGSGKTSFANAVLGLVPLASGSVRLFRASRADASRRDRGDRRDLQIVPQDPMSSLDPRWPVWRTLTEPLTVEATISRRARRAAARELCALVGLDPDAIDRLPQEFSGGQRQRIAIGRALSVEPRLLVLDEPTSALDVSVQAQILNLLLDLQDRRGLAYLFISHNMSVVQHLADRMAVMREGRIVEEGATERVMTTPEHPYTRSLIAAVPQLSRTG